MSIFPIDQPALVARLEGVHYTNREVVPIETPFPVNHLGNVGVRCATGDNGEFLVEAESTRVMRALRDEMWDTTLPLALPRKVVANGKDPYGFAAPFCYESGIHQGEVRVKYVGEYPRTAELPHPGPVVAYKDKLVIGKSRWVTQETGGDAVYVQEPVLDKEGNIEPWEDYPYAEMPNLLKLGVTDEPFTDEEAESALITYGEIFLPLFHQLADEHDTLFEMPRAKTKWYGRSVE